MDPLALLLNPAFLIITISGIYVYYIVNAIHGIGEKEIKNYHDRKFTAPQVAEELIKTIEEIEPISVKLFNEIMVRDNFPKGMSRVSYLQQVLLLKKEDVEALIRFIETGVYEGMAYDYYVLKLKTRIICRKQKNRQ